MSALRGAAQGASAREDARGTHARGSRAADLDAAASRQEDGERAERYRGDKPLYDSASLAAGGACVGRLTDRQARAPWPAVVARRCTTRRRQRPRRTAPPRAA